MIQGKDETFMQSYLKFINNYFQYNNGKKVPILFVEGPTDKDFYYKVFEDTELKIPKINIQHNFAPKDYGKDAKHDKSGNELWIEGWGNPFKDEATELVKRGTSEESFRRNFDFVIAATYYAKPTLYDNLYGNIDCFGFVDKDFGKFDVDGKTLLSYGLDGSNRNISITEFHDRETTVFYNFFPLWYQENNAVVQDDFVEKLRKILIFAAKQGVMEQQSIVSGNCKILKAISNFNFDYLKGKGGKTKKELWTKIKNICCLNKGHLTDFDFEKYFDWCKETEANNLGQWFGVYQDNLEYFFNTCNDEFSKINITNKMLLDWLEGGKENEELKSVFNLANGHMLLNIYGAEFGNGEHSLGKGESKMSETLLSIAQKNDISKIPSVKRYELYRNR